VWFGEAVPEMMNAAILAQHADIFVVIGTSLNVYPAAGLVEYAPKTAPLFIVDPNPVTANIFRKIEHIKEKASTGVTHLAQILKEKYH